MGAVRHFLPALKIGTETWNLLFGCKAAPISWFHSCRNSFRLGCNQRCSTTTQNPIACHQVLDWNDTCIYIYMWVNATTRLSQRTFVFFKENNDFCLWQTRASIFFGEHHGSWFFDIFWRTAFWRPILMPLEFLIVWIYKPLPLHAAFVRVTRPRLTGTLGPSHSLENRCFLMFFCVFCSWLPGQWFFRGHQTPPGACWPMIL